MTLPFAVESIERCELVELEGHPVAECIVVVAVCRPAVVQRARLRFRLHSDDAFVVAVLGVQGPEGGPWTEARRFSLVELARWGSVHRDIQSRLVELLESGVKGGTEQ